MKKPFGVNKRVGDQVVTDLPGHEFGVVQKVEYTQKRGTRVLWALVRIGFQETWFPTSLLFVIPKEWR